MMRVVISLLILFLTGCDKDLHVENSESHEVKNGEPSNAKTCGLKIPAHWDQKLGEGTFGAVYSSKHDGHVVKIAYAMNECKNFHNEKILSDNAYDALRNNPLDISKDFILIVPKIIDFQQSSDDQCCFYEMQRIYAPFPDKCKGIVQLFFGNDFKDLEECNNVGYSLGPDKIAHMLAQKYPQIKPHELAQGIGAFYALLQFAGKQDAFDVEFIFGLDNTNKPVLAAFDYDKSKPVTELKDTQELVALFTRALQNSYFPRPEYEELFAAAQKGYLDTAQKFGFREMAEKVLIRYRKFF